MRDVQLRTKHSVNAQCWQLAGDIVAKLRASNESWDDYHGVPHTFTDADYGVTTQLVAAALWKRTGYAHRSDLDVVGHA